MNVMVPDVTVRVAQLDYATSNYVCYLACRCLFIQLTLRRWFGSTWCQCLFRRHFSDAEMHWTANCTSGASSSKITCQQYLRHLHLPYLWPSLLLTMMTQSPICLSVLGHLSRFSLWYFLYTMWQAWSRGLEVLVSRRCFGRCRSRENLGRSRSRSRLEEKKQRSLSQASTSRFYRDACNADAV